MIERSAGAGALLGLDGFVACAQVEEDGEVWVLVETVDDVVDCRRGGIRAVGSGRRAVKVRDLPAGDRLAVSVWRK